MTHEPECANYGENTLAWPCVCDVIRAAYQRGMMKAAWIARDRHTDLMACLKDDDCHTIARGALLAAEDIAHSVWFAARGDGAL